MSEFPRKLSIVLLFAVLGVCVYRARMQTFTIDEAWVFQLYVDKPLVEMTRVYDAANHVLQTALMKLSCSFFGTGEFSLRIPTLIGAVLYFVAVYRLTAILFRPWMQLLAVAVLVLHPLVLDFFVAARGYGLAVALFTWSLYYVLCYFVKGLDRRNLSRAGLCAGLAIGANLTLLVPAAALGIVLIMLLWRDHRARAVWTAVDSYGGPAVVIAALIVLFPLVAATGNEFYFGDKSLLTTSRVAAESIIKRPNTPILAAVPVLGFLIVPAAFWIIAIGAGLVAYRYVTGFRMDFRLTPFAVFGGTLAVTVALLFTGYHAAGFLYPLHRTGLYLIPLFTLAALVGLEHIRARKTAAILFSLVAIAYISQMETRYFAIWRFDASTPKLLGRLTDDFASRHQPEPAVLATSDVLKRSVNYYKLRRRMPWLTLTETPSAEDADYYLLTGIDRSIATSRHLQILTDDALSGTLLARRPR